MEEKIIISVKEKCIFWKGVQIPLVEETLRLLPRGVLWEVVYSLYEGYDDEGEWLSSEE
jgi:hypothetical protein